MRFSAPLPNGLTASVGGDRLTPTSTSGRQKQSLYYEPIEVCSCPESWHYQAQAPECSHLSPGFSTLSPAESVEKPPEEHEHSQGMLFERD